MFDEQIKWLENKVSTLEKWKDKHPHTKEMKEEIRMLKNIIQGYKRCHSKAEELSWSKYPDRMGQ